MAIASIDDFVRQTVTEWAAETVALLQIEAARRGMVITEDLLRSISYAIVRDAAATAGVELHFNTYGRILDMQRQRVKPQALNRRILLDGKEVRVRKNASTRSWYSKKTYQGIFGQTGLFDRLLHGYADWALQRISTALEQGG